MWFILKSELVIFFILFCTINLFGQNNQKILPSESQLNWADCEIGVLIHFDINIFKPEQFDYKKKETLPDLKKFNPSKLNTDQWIKAAKSAGAKYAILTAKHGTGFCLWKSKAYNYNVGFTPWEDGKGDIVRDFIASCKKYNIKPGIYYNTNINTYLEAGFKPFESPEKRNEYNRIVLQQLSELWTQYGDLFEIWFDGGIVPEGKGGIADEVFHLIKERQSHAILFQGPLESKNLIRWIGNEDGRAKYPNWSRANAVTSSSGTTEIVNYQGSPDGNVWSPAEADFPNIKKSAWNGGWLWKAGEDSLLFSVDDLISRYYTSVGMNANMLIGMAIDTSGQFPAKAAEIFSDFGKEIKKLFGKPLASVAGNGKIIELNISKKPVSVNYIVIQEDISKGERVRKYLIEAFINGKWIKAADGISIGHKRIHKIESLKTTKLRINILESSEKPLISNFAAY